MAATNFQFNAVLRFSGRQAEAGMARVNTRMRAMNQAAQRVSSGLSRMGQASRAISFALAPVALAGINTIRTFANFESQMAAIRSVFISTKEETKELESNIRKLGDKTKFTSVQVGEAAEAFARLGFNMIEVGNALPGVLDAAAASRLGLAETTIIVGGAIRSFNLLAEESTDVADTLTFITAKSATKFNDLGAAMALASPITAQMGFTVAETAAAIGLLANVSVRGTRAGTSLANALIKIIDPSTETTKLLGDMNLLIRKTGKEGSALLPLPVIFTNIAKKIASLGPDIDETAVAVEVFGRRGIRAFSAFNRQVSKSVPVTNINLKAFRLGVQKLGRDIEINIGDSIPLITALEIQAAGATGTAKKMAEISFNTLFGDFVKLSSASENLNVSLGKVFDATLRNIIQKLTAFIRVITRGFILARQKTFDLTKEMKDFKNEFKDLLPATIEFAQGFIQGFNEVKEGIKIVFSTFREFFGQFFDNSKLTNTELGKIASKLLILGTIGAPLFAAVGLALFIIPPILGTIVFLISSVISVIVFLGGLVVPIITGIVTVFGFLASPIVLTISLVALLIDIFQALIRPGKTLDNMFSVQLTKSVIGFFDRAFESAKAFISKFEVLRKLGGAIAKFFSFGDEEEPATAEAPVEQKSKKLVSDIKKASKPKTPSPLEPSISDKAKALEGKKVQAEMVKAKSLSTPPSTDAIVSSIRSQIRSERATKARGGGVVKLTGTLESRIEGRDLLIAVTNAKLDQQTSEGRSPDPRTEGRQRRNGSGF